MVSKKKQWLLYPILIGLVLILQLSSDRGQIEGPPPAISANTVQGQPFDWNQLQGRPAVIYFWASWCGICRTMQHSINAVAEDHPIITVAMLSGYNSAVRSYINRQGFTAPVIVDPDGEISHRYGVTGVPVTFILDSTGDIAFANVGYMSETGMRVRLWLAGLKGRSGD